MHADLRSMHRKKIESKISNCKKSFGLVVSLLTVWKLAGQQHLLLFETNLPKPFVLLTDPFMFLLLLLLLNKSLTKKQTSILPYSAKIFILPFSSWSFLNFFSHLSLKPKTLFVIFSLFPPPLLCFALLSLFSFFVLFLLLLFSFCTKLFQCISPWPISFFSFCKSAFLRIIHWFNWQSEKEASAKSTRQNLIKESLVANRVRGHEERKNGRAVGCFRERIERPKWKQRKKVEKFGLVPVAKEMLYYYYYY